jgi:hypothetical protein
MRDLPQGATPFPSTLEVLQQNGMYFYIRVLQPNWLHRDFALTLTRLSKRLFSYFFLDREAFLSQTASSENIDSTMSGQNQYAMIP